jgi:hypothetical protein
MSQYNIDYAFVKKPGAEVGLTPEESMEWLRCAVDPDYFFTTYCKVVGEKGKMLFEPRSYQRGMIETIEANTHSCLLAPRQCGKSTTLALYALHQTTFNEDFTVGFTSFTTANCKDVLTRFKIAYENLPYFLKASVTLYNRTEVRFSNGSQMYVQVTSENALRGRTNNLCLVDEFAFVSPAIAEEFYTALLPSITAQGEHSTTKAVFVSTPNGTANLFASLAFGAMGNTNGFGFYQVDHTLIPGRTEAFKNQMLKKMSKEKYAQEYECAFLSDSGTLINSSILENLQTIEPKRTFRDEFKIFVDSFKGRTLAMACDVSEGISKDNHAIQVIDLTTFEQVAEFANNTLSQTLYFKEILHIIRFFYEEGIEELYYTVEANSIGQGIIRLIENSEDPYLQKAIMIHDLSSNGTPARIGMLTTSKAKMTGCIQLKDLIESYRLKIHSEKLLTELKFFIKTGSGFAAEKGAKDDRVLPMIILMNMLPQLANYEEHVDEVINELEVEDETWGIVF